MSTLPGAFRESFSGRQKVQPTSAAPPGVRNPAHGPHRFLDQPLGAGVVNGTDTALRHREWRDPFGTPT
ncbi:MAG TPA: hypothetical protein VIM17_12500, partial [Jatrophihabitantaceae bacterium]